MVRDPVGREEFRKKQSGARVRLPRLKAAAPQIADRADRVRLIGPHNKAPAPGRPGQKHDILTRAVCRDAGDVPAVPRGVPDVHSGCDPLTVFEPGQPVETAVEIGRKAALRLPHCPFQKRVVAAEKHVRTLRR